MPEYRIYVLSKEKRIVSPPNYFDFPDDASVIKVAEQIVDGHAVEVWEESRFVTRVEPKEEPDPP